MADEIADIDGKEDFLHVASMYFESLDDMLDVIDMDQSTYYAHLNGRAGKMDLDHAVNLAKVVHLSEPRFRFEDPDDYITVPESDGWGTGRIKLEPEFRKFLFGRRLFDPLNEDLIESISGFSRASYSDYRNEDRWIPEEGYRKLFQYFQREFENEPRVSFDIYDRNYDFPIYEDLDLNQFNQYCVNETIPEKEHEAYPGNPSEQGLFLQKAGATREKFDTLLDDYLEEWEKDVEAFDVRNDIVYSVLNEERKLEPDTTSEQKKIDELIPYGIVRPLSDDSYWIKIE